MSNPNTSFLFSNRMEEDDSCKFGTVKETAFIAPSSAASNQDLISAHILSKVSYWKGGSGILVSPSVNVQPQYGKSICQAAGAAMFQPASVAELRRIKSFFPDGWTGL